jgi:CRP-like cAMP-binding protein
MNQEQIIDILKIVPLFEGLSESQLKTLSKKFTEETFEKKEIIFREGEYGDKLYILVEGKLVLSKKIIDQKENVIAVITPVDAIGEMAILDNEPRSLTVKTIAKCKFLILNSSDFKEIIREVPEISFQIFRILSRRLRTATAAAAKF